MVKITKEEIQEMIEESPCYQSLSASDKDQIISHILNTTLKGGETMEVN